MKGFAVKTDFGLSPADDATKVAWSKVKAGSLCQVDVKRPRNIHRHRLYWALCQHVADALGNVTAENVSDVLKLECGHFRTLRGKTQEWKVPLSISFDKLDEDGFRDLLDRAIQVVAEQWLHALPDSEPVKEIRKILFRTVGGPA